MVDEIVRTRRTGDTRMTWHLSRVLGGTGHRGRKRCVRDVVRNDPTVGEWVQAMAKAGGDGGCEATEIWRQEEYATQAEGTYDRKEVLQVAGVPAEAAGDLVHEGDLAEHFRKMKYNKVVPQGRAMKEMYRWLVRPLR